MANKKLLFWLVLVSILASGIVLLMTGGMSAASWQERLAHLGIWTPLIYIVVYVIATILVLPSTALNLTGGALFGVWLGTLWTSIAALIAAVVSFTLTRTLGRGIVPRRLSINLQELDEHIHKSGLMYIFAIRLLPIIPYGIVNFAAGLTSIRFRDYLLGTLLGTVPGILPFVMLGSSGLRAVQTGDILPLVASLGLIGFLIGGATWFRQRRS